jgi:hypothetical protein
VRSTDALARTQEGTEPVLARAVEQSRRTIACCVQGETGNALWLSMSSEYLISVGRKQTGITALAELLAGRFTAGEGLWLPPPIENHNSSTKGHSQIEPSRS